MECFWKWPIFQPKKFCPAFSVLHKTAHLRFAQGVVGVRWDNRTAHSLVDSLVQPKIWHSLIIKIWRQNQIVDFYLICVLNIFYLKKLSFLVTCSKKIFFGKDLRLFRKCLLDNKLIPTPCNWLKFF